MMRIDRLKDEYVADVWEIEKACFSNPWSREDIQAQVNCDTSCFLVAIEQGKAVGYMGLQIFSGEGYVTNIAVLPQYRGRGIACALMQKQLENDMSFITLEVRESNSVAISLYLKFGFEIIGKRPRFYTNPDEDALIMTKYFNSK